MHPRLPLPAALLTLAGLQADVVSREQALGLEVNRRTLDRLVLEGRWTRLSPGIFRTLPGPVPWRSSAWAGVLIGGDAARLGGAAAGHLHGFVTPEPADILVLIPLDRARPTVDGPWTFARERPGVRTKRCVDDPPRTTVEDTVLDLVHTADDVAAVVDVVTSAVQARLTTAAELREAAERRRTLRHRRVLLGLLADVSEGARSPLEVDFLRDVERAHALRVGRRLVRRGGTEADVLYEEYGLLVELDGRAGHSGTGRFRDLHRDNASTADGLSTLRYGYADVHDRPCEVAGQVGEVLAGRGWPGPLERCDRCRAAHPL